MIWQNIWFFRCLLTLWTTTSDRYRYCCICSPYVELSFGYGHLKKSWYAYRLYLEQSLLSVVVMGKAQSRQRTLFSIFSRWVSMLCFSDPRFTAVWDVYFCLINDTAYLWSTIDRRLSSLICVESCCVQCLHSHSPSQNIRKLVWVVCNVLAWIVFGSI